MPLVDCAHVPQQKNDYDCGIFMLSFIERLATAPLPSFEHLHELVETYGTTMLPGQEAVSQRRDDFRRLLCEKGEVEDPAQQ